MKTTIYYCEICKTDYDPAAPQDDCAVCGGKHWFSEVLYCLCCYMKPLPGYGKLGGVRIRHHSCTVHISSATGIQND